MADIIQYLWNGGRRIGATVWWGALIAYSIMIYYLSSGPVPDELDTGWFGFDKVLHCGAYAFWASLCLAGLARSAPKKGYLWRSVVAVVATLLYGASDEFHQYFVPGRSASLWDMAADLLGGVLAVLFWGLVRGMVQKKW